MVTGKMTSNMAKELNNGPKVQSLKDSTSNRRNRDKEDTPGWTDLPMMENGTTTKFTAVEFTSGETGAATMVSGTRMICRVTDITSTPTGFSTTGSTRKIRRKAMENISGQTADDTKDGGTEASSTASVFTLTRNGARRSTAFGRWANGLSGSMKLRLCKLTKVKTPE